LATFKGINLDGQCIEPQDFQEEVTKFINIVENQKEKSIAIADSTD
jgi:hypothetical protein